MKPIIKEEKTETILTSDITDIHLVVGIIFDRPSILSKGYTEGREELTFCNLEDTFVYGNGFNYTSADNTIQKMVELAIDNTENKVAVFKQDDWKQALQWLIYNA